MHIQPKRHQYIVITSSNKTKLVQSIRVSCAWARD